VWNEAGNEEEGRAARARIPAHPHERSAVPVHPQITKRLLCSPLQRQCPRALLTRCGRLGSFQSDAGISRFSDFVISSYSLSDMTATAATVSDVWVTLATATGNRVSSP
jgi:hypothetical protein